jgi:hypothetical protein
MIPERLKQCSNDLIAWNKLLYFCTFYSDFNDSCSFEQPIFLYTAYNILRANDNNLAISNWKSFSSLLKMKYIMLTFLAISKTI